MDTANQEFRDLLARSGWNQSEAARKLELTSASVSRYVNDIDKPTKQTLRLFRLCLGDVPNEIRETSPPYRVTEPASNKKTIAKLRRQVQDLRNKVNELEIALDEL